MTTCENLEQDGWNKAWLINGHLWMLFCPWCKAILAQARPARKMPPAQEII